MWRDFRQVLRVTSLLIGLAPLSGCGYLGDPVRPASVPAGATPVNFDGAGGWAYCRLDTEANVNRCRTYNAAGERLYLWGHENDEDDVFLRDEGVGPVPEAELQISRIRTSPGHVWLRNGVVLLPRNDFENYKRLVDAIKAGMRKRNLSPRSPL